MIHAFFTLQTLSSTKSRLELGYLRSRRALGVAVPSKVHLTTSSTSEVSRVLVWKMLRTVSFICRREGARTTISRNARWAARESSDVFLFTFVTFCFLACCFARPVARGEPPTPVLTSHPEEVSTSCTRCDDKGCNSSSILFTHVIPTADPLPQASGTGTRSLFADRLKKFDDFFYNGGVLLFLVAVCLCCFCCCWFVD